MPLSDQAHGFISSEPRSSFHDPEERSPQDTTANKKSNVLSRDSIASIKYGLERDITSMFIG